VQDLLLADDQVIIIRGVDDVNYMGIKSEEEFHELGLKIFYGKSDTQRSFEVIANQREIIPN
jgi:hypothetical protein